MLKFNIFLTLILVICALGVVTAQHEARKLFVMLEKERTSTGKLNMEWDKLQLEQSTLVTHRRIEDIARSKLNMSMPSASRVRFILPNETLDLIKSGEMAKP